MIIGDRAIANPADGGLYFARASTNEPFILFSNNSGSSQLAQIRGANGGGLKFTNSTSAIEWARFDANGNMGIGTSTPYAKLSIWGANTTAGVRAFEIVDSASTTNFYVENGGLTGLKDLLAIGSTTLQNFTFVNATGTSATTTNLFATALTAGNSLFGNATSTSLFTSKASTTQLFLATGTGCLQASASGLVSASNSACLSASNINQSKWATSTGSDITPNGGGGIMVFSSSTLSLLNVGNSTTTNATSTNFFATTASSTNLFSSLLNVGGNTLLVNSSNNVGIGTSTPWGKLSVTNVGAGPSFVVEDSASPDNSMFVIDAAGNVGTNSRVVEVVNE
jgi:hypothetical protein